MATVAPFSLTISILRKGTMRECLLNMNHRRRCSLDGGFYKETANFNQSAFFSIRACKL